MCGLNPFDIHVHIFCVTWMRLSNTHFYTSCELCYSIRFFWKGRELHENQRVKGGMTTSNNIAVMAGGFANGRKGFEQ